uniref:small monomeric GTPase n=1 Tax=Schistosoma mansoni TaxID=6183 RepID=A0A5K4F7W6_SCHMA
MNHYIDMTNLVVVVFDVTDHESFSSAKLTLTEFRKSLNYIRIPVVLVGNKIDLKAKRINSVEEAQALADDLSIPYFETSAVSPYFFVYMASSVHQL